MRFLLLTLVFLWTSVGYGQENKAQTSTPVNQLMMEDSKPSVNHFSSGITKKRSYIDTTDYELRASPKPEKKRHLFAKTVLGLAGAFVAAVIIFIVVTGGWEFKY